MNVLFISNRLESGLKPHSSPSSGLEVGVCDGLLPKEYKSKVRNCMHGNHYDVIVAYADTEVVRNELLDLRDSEKTGRCKLRVVAGNPAKIKKYLERYSRYTGKPITA